MLSVKPQKTQLQDSEQIHESGLVLPDTTDDALRYLKDHGGESNFVADDVRMRKLKRKIDFIVIPFLALPFLANYLDKVLFNYANVMGISQDLKLVGNQYTNAASAFWIAVLVAEVPNAYLLQRLPTSKWLGACLFAWGISTACTAATHDYATLVVTRVFSGLFEAAVVPALMLISGQWYTRQEQVSRFVWWYLGTSVGFTLGGLISWAFQHVSSTATFASWRIMYLVLGCLTILFAVLFTFLVPTTPMEASFLSNAEKVTLLQHVKGNETGVQNRHFRAGQVLEALMDPQLYLMWLMELLGGCSGGLITTYSSFVIKSFGYTSRRAALLNMGLGGIAVPSTFIAAAVITRYGNRWVVISVCAIGAAVGVGLLTWLPRTDKSGNLAGIYLAQLIVAPNPVLYAWLSVNIAGHSKRSFAFSVLNAAFAVGNIIGPQTFQAKDAPGYKPAKLALFVMLCAVVGDAVVLKLYYRYENGKRDKEVGRQIVDGECDVVGEVDDEKAYAGLTDRKNRGFRYLT